MNIVPLLRYSWYQFKARKLRRQSLWFWDLFQIALFTLLIGTIFSSVIDDPQTYFFVGVGYSSFVFGKSILNASATFHQGYVQSYKKCFINKTKGFAIHFFVAVLDNVIFVSAIFVLGWFHFGYHATGVVIGALVLVLCLYALVGGLLAFVCNFVPPIGSVVAQCNRYAIFITPVIYDKKLMPEHLAFIFYLNPHYWCVTLVRSSWV